MFEWGIFGESSRALFVIYTSCFELLNTSCYIFCNKNVPKAFEVRCLVCNSKNKFKIWSMSC